MTSRNDSRQQHTPTPWHLGEPYTTDDGSLELAIYAELPEWKGKRVYPACVCLQFPNAEKMQVANAHFILEAVNAYEWLLTERERLRQALDGLLQWINPYTMPEEHFASYNAALDASGASNPNGLNARELVGDKGNTGSGT